MRAVAWLRANPHRFDLGRVGFVLRHTDGRKAEIADLAATSQTLDFWRGVVKSRFELDGKPARVVTVCHPDRDLLAVRIESPLLTNGQLQVKLAFPYASGEWGKAADWNNPQRHHTTWNAHGNRSDFERVLDDEHYSVSLVSSKVRLSTETQNISLKFPATPAAYWNSLSNSRLNKSLGNCRTFLKPLPLPKSIGKNSGPPAARLI